MSEADIVKLSIAAASAVAELVADHVGNGDATVLQKRIVDILPAELLVEIARAAADVRAKAKFGSP